MPNLHEIEDTMPVAPLKIVALPSARAMGQRINDYLVEFRKTIQNDKVKTDPAFQGYSEKNYLINAETFRFGTKQRPSSGNRSAARICFFWLTYVITVLPTI